jgi:hypothetical protein
MQTGATMNIFRRAFPILGGAREIFGVFHVKNHDFTTKKIIFLPILGGGGRAALFSCFSKEKS